MEHTKYISTHNDVILASPLLISKMFREMVKEYEEELKAIEDDQNGTGLSGDEIVLLYDILLAELSVNSKVSITDLTIIAGQQIMLGAGIADAICHRIVEESVEQKLASLYLLDSIVKNIGRDYIKYFSARLPEVFCEAYKQVHPNMHRTMRLLLGSWSTVFPLSVLKKIESGLQFTSSANHQSLRASSSNLSRNQLRPPAAVRFNNGLDVDRIRALIDAYGTDKRTERIDDIPTMSWKNSEEEEFDWEKMSPTLADEGKNDVISSSLQSHLRQDWPNQKQFPAVNGPMLQTYQPVRPISGQLDNLNGNNLLVNQVAPASFMGPPPLLAHQFQRGYAPGRMASVGTMVPSPYTQSPLPLPHGFSGASHTRPIGAPNRPPLGNLCSSLMAQGVISLNQTAAKEDQVGLEFNPDLLKDITDEGSRRKRMRI